MDTEIGAAADAPKPDATAGRLVDEFLAAKAETRAKKRALVAGINQLTDAVRNATHAVRSAREQLEDL